MPVPRLPNLDGRPSWGTLFIGLAAALLFTLYWLHALQAVPCSGSADCVRYLQMANAYRDHAWPQVIDAPYHVRVLAPWVAAQFSRDGTLGFLVLNALSLMVFTWSCWAITRRLGLRNIEYFALLTWFLLHPLGFGLYHSVPASTDPLSHALLGLATLLFLNRQGWWLMIGMLIALLAKESFLFVALIMVISELASSLSPQDIRQRHDAWRRIAWVICAILLYKVCIGLTQHYLFQSTTNPTAWDTVRYFWREVRREPARLLVWLTAIACVTGTFSVLWLRKWNWPKSADELRTSSYFMLGCAGFIALGLVGGSDMSRIIFTGNLLVLGAMLMLPGRQVPSTWRVLAPLLLSLLIALTYMNWLPALLEYDYYMQGKRLQPTLSVLGGTIALWIVTAVVTRRRKLKPS